MVYNNNNNNNNKNNCQVYEIFSFLQHKQPRLLSPNISTRTPRLCIQCQSSEVKGQLQINLYALLWKLGMLCNRFMICHQTKKETG